MTTQETTTTSPSVTIHDQLRNYTETVGYRPEATIYQMHALAEILARMPGLDQEWEDRLNLLLAAALGVIREQDSEKIF